MTSKLTKYSLGAGYDGKISPAVLKQADSLNLPNGTSIIGSTDFFIPIAENPDTLVRRA